jgi:hypothetical protein
MPTSKRIDGDYNITTLNPADNVTVQTHTLEVRGNLDVTGNLTYINVEELNIRDPFIVLNSSNTGSYESNSGILTHKTATDFAGLRYNNNTSQWEISSSTSASGETGTWNTLATGNVVMGAAGSNTQIQFNTGGSFDAVSNFSFEKTQQKLTLQGHQIFGNIGNAPAAVANSLALYHRQESSGGTGLWYRTTISGDELVSRRKAIVFSIIF